MGSGTGLLRVDSYSYLSLMSKGPCCTFTTSTASSQDAMLNRKKQLYCIQHAHDMYMLVHSNTPHTAQWKLSQCDINSHTLRCLIITCAVLEHTPCTTEQGLTGLQQLGTALWNASGALPTALKVTCSSAAMSADVSSEQAMLYMYPSIVSL